MKVKEKQPSEFWLRLDNAARIYPAIRSRELTAVFRVSADFKDTIKKAPFLEAIHEIEHRFPYYKVRLRIGFFWYYLEHSPLPVAVESGIKRPCRAFEKRKLLFRVFAEGRCMGVEFSHILTDATGAFEFLKSLLLVYCERCGIAVPPELPRLRPGEPVDKEEYEDGYSRYFKKGPSSSIEVRKAFHLPFPLKKAARFEVLTAIVPLDQVSRKAGDHGVSLTVYFIAVYLFSLQQVYNHLPARRKRRSNRIIRIEVPVNLRKIFPSKTMRNFSLYVLPEIDLRLGYYTFEEIIKSVYHQMQLETDQKLINKIISRNVGSLNNNFVRRVPLFIKSFILSKFYAIGTGRYSGVITNLGKIDLTPGINDLIDNFKFIPPPPNKILKVNCGIVGFGNKVMLCFGNITASRELEKTFIRFLQDQGIQVDVMPLDGGQAAPGDWPGKTKHAAGTRGRRSAHDRNTRGDFPRNIKGLFRKKFHV